MTDTARSTETKTLPILLLKGNLDSFIGTYDAKLATTSGDFRNLKKAAADFKTALTTYHSESGGITTHLESIEAKLTAEYKAAEAKYTKTVADNADKRSALDLQLRGIHDTAGEAILEKTAVATQGLVDKFDDDAGFTAEIADYEKQIRERSCWAACLPYCCRSQIDREIDAKFIAIQAKITESKRKFTATTGAGASKGPTPEAQRAAIRAEIEAIHDPSKSDVNRLRRQLTQFQERLTELATDSTFALPLATMLEFIRIDYWVKNLRDNYKSTEETPLTQNPTKELDEIVVLLDQGLDEYYCPEMDGNSDLYAKGHVSHLNDPRRISAAERMEILLGTGTPARKAELQTKLFTHQTARAPTPPRSPSVVIPMTLTAGGAAAAAAAPIALAVVTRHSPP